ncbi:response regulator [Flavobacterium sp.]|uniref:response regulator n=1 Tax=Flavobacterium sp. TaxID=239 RepID=UPI0024876B72|nr:response regulator [Flavobacterium sp.]MDI1316349.1 response regulator [Flavobacterium sp.]
MLKKRSVILLIDDDSVIDFLHKKLLIRAGITDPIITLYNGKTAIDELLKLNNQLNENDTILALLDINMPVLDGWGFLQELAVINSSLKFKLELFIVSSSSNPDDIIKSKSNPYVIDYLNKPLTSENIIKYLL